MRIAETKSQAHLLALVDAPRHQRGAVRYSGRARRPRGRAQRSPPISDARLSESGFTTLVKRAEQDGVLAEKVGMRTDIPPRLFRELLMQASEVVQQRLLAQAKPETQAEIRRVLPRSPTKSPPRRRRAITPPRWRRCARCIRQRKLSEADVAEFAKAGKYEETIAALATLCSVPVEVVDRLMSGERADPVLILARAAGFGWPTVRAIIIARPGAKAVDARRSMRPARISSG